MIRVAVIEDEQTQREEIARMVRAYAGARRLDIDIACWGDPTKLVSAYEHPGGRTV